KKDNEIKIENDFNLFEDDDKNEIKIENDEIKIENDFNLFEDDINIENIKIDNDIHLFEDDDKDENIKIENDDINIENIKIDNDDIKIDNDIHLFEDDDKNEIKIENDEIKIENDFNFFEDDNKDENIKIENDEIKIENDFNLFEDDDKNEIKIENDFNLFEDEDEKSGNKDFGIKDKNLNAPKTPKIPTLSAQTLGKPASVPTLSAQTLGKPASVPTLSAQTLGKPASVPPPVSQPDMTLQAPDEDEFNLDIDLDFDMDAPSIDLSDMLDEPEAPKSPTPPPISSDALATPAPGMKKDFNIPETQAEPMPNWFNNHNLNKNERHSPSSEGTKPTAEALQPVQEVSAVRGRPGITTESTMSQHPDLNKTPPPPQISKASLLSTNSGLLMPPVGGIGFHKGTTVTETLKPTAVSLTPVNPSDHHDGKPTAISMQAISSTSPNLRDPKREDMALQTLKPFHRIPRLRIPLADLSRRRDINPRAGFILSNIDGITSIRDILDISAFPEPQTALLLVELEEQGIIAFR
ncbi:MAG: hypothetical protein J6S69_09075, partial [Proteobacteria bacterium]|nr:hypothetical protein [Pseudomonadota bacterium]